jgi:concanavalin A-like lectin/glucanase superfamily protein
MISKLVLLSLLLLPLIAAAELPAAANLDADPHLQGWWTFDETAGATAADSSSHKRSGKLAGGNSVAGRIGNALSLDEDEVVTITGYKGVVGTGPRTIAIWMKTDSPEGEVVAWGTKDFGRMWKLCFYRKHIGANPEGGYFYMAADIHDGEWHHVAAVVHEAELPNLHDDVTLYLDGEIAEIDDIGLLDLWPIETEAGEDVTIGAGYKGAVDELRIYDRELSDEEIAALHSMGK